MRGLEAHVTLHAAKATFAALISNVSTVELLVHHS